MLKIFSLLMLLLLFLWAPKTALSDELLEIKNQVRDAQGRVKALEERLNQQMERQQGLSKPSDANRGLVVEIPDVENGVKTGGLSIPNLTIKGFSDLHFNAEGDIKPGEKNPSAFSLGQFDLFITSALSEHIGVLAEVVIEFDEDTNNPVIDLERIQINFSLSDIFNIRLGRMHTPLGYWNQTFHHGAWFQTTASRGSVKNPV